MILKDWSEKHGVEVHEASNGARAIFKEDCLVAITGAIEDVILELYELEDYAVSTSAGLTIWVVPRVI